MIKWVCDVYWTYNLIMEKVIAIIFIGEIYYFFKTFDNLSKSWTSVILGMNLWILFCTHFIQDMLPHTLWQLVTLESRKSYRGYLRFLLFLSERDDFAPPSHYGYNAIIVSAESHIWYMLVILDYHQAHCVNIHRNGTQNNDYSHTISVLNITMSFHQVPLCQLACCS